MKQLIIVTMMLAGLLSGGIAMAQQSGRMAQDTTGMARMMQQIARSPRLRAQMKSVMMHEMMTDTSSGTGCMGGYHSMMMNMSMRKDSTGGGLMAMMGNGNRSRFMMVSCMHMMMDMMNMMNGMMMHGGNAMMPARPDSGAPPNRTMKKYRHH